MGTELTLSARGSGSSNTTKTNSTDNSSRHSNASTTPSSADLNGQEDWKISANKKSVTEYNTQSSSRPNSGFLKTGRSWSFGGNKKQLPPTPAAEEDVPVTPQVPEQYKAGRARATTSSTDATVTPPQLDQDFGRLDLGGSFSKMLLGFDKRSSVMTLQNENARQALQPSAMTGGRVNAPSPIQIDRMSNVEPPQHSWASHRSDDNLLSSENTPPPVPKHGGDSSSRPQVPHQPASDNILKRTSAIFSGRRKSFNALGADENDDISGALLAVGQFMSSDGNSRSVTPVEAVGRPRQNDSTPGSGYTVVQHKSPVMKLDTAEEDDNMFDNIPLTTSRMNTPRQARPQPRQVEKETPAQNKVMTPSEFERYRKDKEVESRRAEVERAREQVVGEEDEEEDIYEDDEDEMEKSKQLAKQRRKQEAHMSVYRQQMMKVTGESMDAFPMRPSMSSSLSTPNLVVPESSRNNSSSDVSEDDEEVPLAILAAHGFPNKNRPPTRLNNMMSNPNLRQAAQPSYQRPGSAQGQAPTGNGPLPPFARGLPQDPYGLVNPSNRESFAMGGGVPAGQNPPVPPGGLVGVIANEERARSMRRGSPQVPPMDGYQGAPGMGPGIDPMYGIPPQMMYPQAMQQMQMQQMQNMMLSPGDQAQIQLSQQMSQFMQMQMQFMQMMAGNNGNNAQGVEPPRSAGHLNSQSLNHIPPMNAMGVGMGVGMDMNTGVRSSFLEPPMADAARGDMHGRTMSMVQPSSSSWLQPTPAAGYAGSIRGGQGYAPSVAPSERSNVGLPGRYRPVSQMPAASTTPDQSGRKSHMSGALSPLGDNKTPRAGDKTSPKKSITKVDADDDDEEGWAAMKAKRDEKKKSTWRLKKSLGHDNLDIGSLIT